MLEGRKGGSIFHSVPEPNGSTIGRNDTDGRESWLPRKSSFLSTSDPHGFSSQFLLPCTAMVSYGHLSISLSQLLYVMSLLRLLTKHPFLRPNSPCWHLSILFMAFILRSCGTWMPWSGSGHVACNCSRNSGTWTQELKSVWGSSNL